MSRYFPPHRLSYLLASHADPDIIASLDRWLSSPPAGHLARMGALRPHFAKLGKTENRIIGVPDGGGLLPLGRHELLLLPALHAFRGQLPLLRPVHGRSGRVHDLGRRARVP
ncbi:beta-lactamase domain-containing protein [Alicycliphilus sp. B1]|nr:beta-lactamase domain-containing protein [Alicycliphilus sp. B1]